MKTGTFQPFSEKPTLFFPGFDGGAEWGGAAVDPDGMMYVNANEMPWVASLSATPKEDQMTDLSPGQRVFALNCSGCHGPDRKGNPQSGYPSLTQIADRRSREQVSAIISSGKV